LVLIGIGMIVVSVTLSLFSSDDQRREDPFVAKTSNPSDQSTAVFTAKGKTVMDPEDHFDGAPAGQNYRRNDVRLNTTAHNQKITGEEGAASTYPDTFEIGDTQWLASIDREENELAGNLDALREYKRTLQEAYQIASSEGDKSFVRGVITELREVGKTEARLVGKRYQASYSESAKEASGKEQNDSFTDHRDQQTQYDCRRPSEPGQFVCPCPSDPFYTKRWREAYNPEFLADKNCQY